MVTITTMALFAATWLLFGGITVVLWRRTAGAIAREDALRISIETMLMRSRFRDAPPVSPSVLGRADPERRDVRVDEDGPRATASGASWTTTMRSRRTADAEALLALFRRDTPARRRRAGASAAGGGRPRCIERSARCPCPHTITRGIDPHEAGCRVGRLDGARPRFFVSDDPDHGLGDQLVREAFVAFLAAAILFAAGWLTFA